MNRKSRSPWMACVMSTTLMCLPLNLFSQEEAARQKSPSPSIKNERSLLAGEPPQESATVKSEQPIIVIEATILEVKHELTLIDALANSAKASKLNITAILEDLKKQTAEDLPKAKGKSKGVQSNKGVVGYVEKDVLASISIAESQILESVIKSMENSRVLTSPRMTTFLGQSASIFSGQSIAVRQAEKKQKTTEMQFNQYGMRLEVLPTEGKSRETELDRITNLQVLFERKDLVDEQIRKTMADQASKFSKIYSPTFGKDGQPTGEKLVFDRPENPSLLFEISRFAAEKAVAESEVLVFAVTDKPSSLKKEVPARSTIVFLNPRQFTREELRDRNEAKELAEANRKKVQPRPSVPEATIVSTYGRKANLPINLRITAPEGAQIGVGESRAFQNETSINVDSNLHLFKANISSSEPGSDYSIDATFFSFDFDFTDGDVELELNLTKEEIARVNKSNFVVKTVVAPNVVNKTRIPKNDKLFTVIRELENFDDAKMEKLNDGFDASGSRLCGLIFLKANKVVLDKDRIVGGFPFGGFLNLVSELETGYLDPCELKLDAETAEHAKRGGRFDLYGAYENSANSYLIKSAVSLDVGQAMSRSGDSWSMGIFFLSRKDATAFKHAKQNGRVELRPVVEAKATSSKPKSGMSDNVATRTSDRRIAEKSGQNDVVPASFDFQMPTSSMVSREQNVLTEINKMRADVSKLKSDIQKVLEILEKSK